MISPSAFVHPEARLGVGVVVEPFAYVGAGVVVGDGTWLGPHATLLSGTTVGRECKIFPGAVIGAAEFAAMKDGVLLVNAARGGVVDEDALLAALDSGKVRAAGLDVFVGEPKPRAELLQHPRIAATPHIGAATVEAQDRIGQELADIVATLSSEVSA